MKQSANTVRPPDMTQPRNPHDKTHPATIHMKWSLFTVAARMAEVKGMTFSEYVSGVLHADIESARALKESLDQVFADGDTERDA